MAMKVIGLMTGDLIQVKRGLNGHLTNEKIKGLIDDDDESYPITLATEETASLNDVVPIPLTEDILVKNGFKKVNEHYECIVYKQLAGDGFEMQQIIIHPNNVVTIYTCIARILIHIDFVHQLQHLLRLVDVQKEIEL